MGPSRCGGPGKCPRGLGERLGLEAETWESLVLAGETEAVGGR